MRLGILAVQGDYEAHAKVLQRLEVPFIYITQPRQLSGVSGLILPGGESTTMLKFLSEDGFSEAIVEFAQNGRGVFGTCAGAILLAKEVINPFQVSLQLIDVTIERNAYGRQLASHIVTGDLNEEPNSLEMVFIRAPKIIQIGHNVKVFATYQGQPVGVSMDRFMLTTFHPELTHNNKVHRIFVDLCRT